MGSSSRESDYDRGAIAPAQTPATTPPQPPPTYPSFLPQQAGQLATGLTQQHYNDIAASDAAQQAAVQAAFTPQQPAAATPEQAIREVLAELLASEDPRRRYLGESGRVGGFSGAMDRGGYSTSGRTGGAYSGPGGTRSSARYGGGLI